MMHLVAGEVDFVCHVRVPAVTVQSCAPSDGLYDYAGQRQLAWLDRSFWVHRGFNGRRLGVVLKTATLRVS